MVSYSDIDCWLVVEVYIMAVQFKFVELLLYHYYNNIRTILHYIQVRAQLPNFKYLDFQKPTPRPRISPQGQAFHLSVHHTESYKILPNVLWCFSITIKVIKVAQIHLKTNMEIPPYVYIVLIVDLGLYWIRNSVSPK